jgi:hypothetical protein
MIVSWAGIIPTCITISWHDLPDVGPICAESPCIEENFGVCKASVALKLAELLRFKVAALICQKLEFRISPSLT